MEKNRREEIRHKIWLEVNFYLHKEFFPSAIATDISASGIRIETSKALVPGTRIIILSKLYEDEIEIRGKTIWTLSKPGPAITVYEVGVNTDTIIYKGITAREAGQRSELVQQILYSLMESSTLKS